MVQGAAKVALRDRSDHQPAQAAILARTSSGQGLARNGRMDGFGYLCLQSLAAELTCESDRFALRFLI
jgi:hypothetical protein